MSVHSPRPLASSRTRSKKNLPRCSFPSNVPPLTPDHRVMSHHSINRTSHSISIHNAVSATPKTVPGATRAFASSGTPADCTMLGISVLYRAKRFDYIVSGVNRGDNLGLHVVYSGTVAGAREGAMRTGAVGVAVSLDSYSRSADYSEAVSLFSIFVRAIRLTTAAVCFVCSQARFTAELVSAVHDTPGLTETLRGVVLNVNVPNLPKDAIRGVKLTKPGVSCTQAEWVRVPGDESPNGKGKSLSFNSCMGN